MKLLVIGKGGREHALVWKLAQSPRVERVYCAPGNAGTAIDGVNVPIDQNDIDELVRFARKELIDLTVVGPEEPLALGIVDAFQNAHLRIFGPTAAAAQIESNKAFAKQLMRDADVPTAEFRIFDHPEPARSYIESREYVVFPDGERLLGPFAPGLIVTEGKSKFFLHGNGRRLVVASPEPVVVKASGLAAGKGVMVCETTEEALAAIDRIMVREEFGAAAGRVIVIERRLQGLELSILALVAGRTIMLLPATQDHKRALDDDAGPNTGGMGAYCPAPLADAALLQNVEQSVLIPTIHTMRHRQSSFRGLLYAGLMVTNQGPRVLEFNSRFGDPEAQALLMRLRSDLLDLLVAVVDDKLDEIPDSAVDWDPRPSVCVIMASEGYPGSYRKGHVIDGLAEVATMPDVKVFHAGTKREKDKILTDGGRVLGITALGNDLADARQRAYAAVARIRFTGAFWRTDIAAKALQA